MPRSSPKFHKGKTILLAEDEELVQDFIRYLLMLNNYDVIVAENGVEALEQSREHSGEIHLLLSDVQMPQMTGTELAAQITIERPNIKIILMSGFSAEMLALNHDWQFLPKPFDADTLMERIRTVLGDTRVSGLKLGMN